MRTRRHAHVIAVGLTLGALGPLGGCSETRAEDSVDVATADLSAFVTIVDEGAGTTLRVELVGPGAHVHLAPGERFVVHVGAASMALVSAPGAENEYVANLPDFSGDLQLDFERVNDHGVQGLAIPVPPPFTLTLPNAPVSRAAPLPIAWSGAGSGYDLALAVDGPCAHLPTRALSRDDGGYVVQAGELFEPADAGAPSCTATVTVTRSLSTHASFGGPGRFDVDARRVRKGTMESTP
jgi:hypothetical protein